MWNEIPVAHQWSNLYSAYSIDTKLRSLGITDYLNIRLNEEQIFIISQVEHNRWNIEKLLLGFRKPTPEEQKVIDNNDTQRKEYKINTLYIQIFVPMMNYLKGQGTMIDALLQDIIDNIQTHTIIIYILWD